MIDPPTRGGPDAFGYTWANNHDENGPQFGAYGISGTTPLPITGDDEGTSLALPFEFPFYGTYYDTVYVSTNGYLTFDSADITDYSNDDIPSSNYPNSIVCGLWEDLSPIGDGAVHYYHDNARDRVIIQWEAMALFRDNVFPEYTSLMTHQTILYPDGSLEFVYMDISENALGSSTVGIENADATDGLRVGYNGSGGVIADKTIVRIRPPAPESRPTRGGPEDLYTWINSLDPAGPIYEWEDIVPDGQLLSLNANDAVVELALPFPFPFYDSTYDSISVSSDGWLSFETGLPANSNNQPIPDPGSQNKAIYPFWDNLDPSTGGWVHYLDDSPNNRVLFQWTLVPHWGFGSDRYTFQAVLYRNGEIYFNYETMSGILYATRFATVGIENADGSMGLQVNYNNNGGMIDDGITVAILPSNRPVPEITDLRITYEGLFAGIVPTYSFDWTPLPEDIFGLSPLAGYRLYSSSDPRAPWPEGWNPAYSTPGPPTETIGFFTEKSFFRVVPVDANGNPIAVHSGPFSGARRPNTETSGD